jgi:hypothetical protein
MEWSIRAPAKVTVLLWHASHGALVTMWFAGFPVALPPWQVAQRTMSPAWFIRAPAKVAVLLWQVSHGELVATWACGLPGAPSPLWQAAQLLMIPLWSFLDLAGRAFGDGAAIGAADALGAAAPGTNPVGPAGAGVIAVGVAARDDAALRAGVLVGTVAPAKVTVLKWQFPHGADVTMWLAGLPTAHLPLWQLAQGPSAWAWSINRKSRHVVVRWQPSHRFVVRGCNSGSPGAVMVLWQATHLVGVPSKRPLEWQEAQETLMCVPLSGKPVRKWLNGVVNGDCAKAGVTLNATTAKTAGNILLIDLNEIIEYVPHSATCVIKGPGACQTAQIVFRSDSSDLSCRQQSVRMATAAEIACDLGVGRREAVGRLWPESSPPRRVNEVLTAVFEWQRNGTTWRIWLGDLAAVFGECCDPAPRE